MKTELKNVREAMARLEAHEARVRSFYDDPMTEACGCTGDFQEQFDREERYLAAYILTHSKPESRRWKFAQARLEKFMP